MWGTVLPMCLACMAKFFLFMLGNTNCCRYGCLCAWWTFAWCVDAITLGLSIVSKHKIVPVRVQNRWCTGVISLELGSEIFALRMRWGCKKVTVEVQLALMTGGNEYFCVGACYAEVNFQCDRANIQDVDILQKKKRDNVVFKCHHLVGTR